MKAVRIHQPGGPEVLQYEDCPDPTAGPGQVLIRTAAIGLNFAETRVRQGAAPASLPLILGGEAAGTVVAVGSDVTEFSEGDAVAVANASQCYAELVAAPVGRTVKLPPGMDAKLAAASLVQGMTAHCMALGAYKVRRNDWILVHAGAGGVGMLITQMAKRRGAKVIATVGSDAKIAAAKEVGADVVVNYTTQDFEVEVKSITNGIGVNGIFDSVGKATFLKGLNCLAELGTIAVFGYASGDTDPLDINLLHRGGSLRDPHRYGSLHRHPGAVVAEGQGGPGLGPQRRAGGAHHRVPAIAGSRGAPGAPRPGEHRQAAADPVKEPSPWPPS